MTVGNVVRGSLCSAWVGYWVGTHAVGGGVATAAVALVVDHSFAASPGCTGSRRPSGRRTRPACGCSSKLGFREEGLFRVISTSPAAGATTVFRTDHEDVPNGLVAG